MADTEKKSKYSKIDHQSSQNNDNQAESCRNVIIVNQLPDNIDVNKLIPIFSEFGKVENVYISMEKRKPDSDEAYNHEFARITYSSEEEAASVAKAFQEGKIKYDEHSLMITQTAEDCCLIEKLPNNCLVEIFLHLTRLQDKLNCELVSKKWNKLAKESWTTITDLSTTKNINIIVPRAGKYLRNVSLSFDYKPDELQNILTLLAENCERIERLHFYPRYWRYERHPRYTATTSDFKLLKSIIRRNKNLRSLELHFRDLMLDNESTDLNLMDDFPATLERIVIDAKQDYSPIDVRDLPRFKNLQILSLDSVIVEMTGIENLSNLKHLKISSCSVMDLSDIRHLRNLEYFSTCNSSICDDVFEEIVKNNKKLKFLEISSEQDITDASFQFVQYLPELKVLIIDVSRNVTERYIANMPTVRYVNFHWCCQITDRAFKQFLDTATDIETIAAFGEQLTIDAIRTANEWTKSTGKSLTIYVSQRLETEFADLDIEKDAKLHISSFGIDSWGVSEVYEKRYAPVWP